MGSTGDRDNRARPRRRPPAAREVPVRLPEHAHLRLDELRDYRAALRDEQRQADYWQAVLGVRLDAVQAGPAGPVPAPGGTRTLDAHTLRRALQTERVNAGRNALRRLVPGDDLPELPDLAELWARPVVAGDQSGHAQLAGDLLAAAAQVRHYRDALLNRLDRATGEHIARYRDQPDLALAALPLPPDRPGADRDPAT